MLAASKIFKCNCLTAQWFVYRHWTHQLTADKIDKSIFLPSPIKCPVAFAVGYLIRLVVKCIHLFVYAIGQLIRQLHNDKLLIAPLGKINVKQCIKSLEMDNYKGVNYGTHEYYASKLATTGCFTWYKHMHGGKLSCCFVNCIDLQILSLSDWWHAFLQYRVAIGLELI